MVLNRKLAIASLLFRKTLSNHILFLSYVMINDHDRIL